ncbi:MAG TPA: hypothetical protein DIU39_05595 [Flavobacteriales bacterium]|mgnify:CR=1 FL=1|nr:hypothetical protein [Flavobacteriales bacterium]|tara:strand:- start:47537 stop:49534 length:1998 start_codon:yes stop_codon:yes gene_type:complete
MKTFLTILLSISIGWANAQTLTYTAIDDSYDVNMGTVVSIAPIINDLTTFGAKRFDTLLNVFNSNISVVEKNILGVKLSIPNNYIGVDSFLYVGYATDGNGNRSNYDTAKIIIHTHFKFGTVVDSLKIGNISVITTNTGNLFQTDYAARFTTNKTSLIYSSQIHVLSKTNNNFFATPLWASTGNGFGAEYVTRPGPLTDTIFYSESQQLKWNKIWHITSYDIDLFNQWVNSGMPAGFNIPSSILNWPAHGDTAMGESWMVAPFVDKNNNNIYEPQLGDYPKIKGKEALWFVYHLDKTKQSNILPLEMQIMLYTYDCPKDSALKNTVFLNAKLINRSNQQFDSCFITNYVDADLGNYQDDYLGSMPNRNAMYFYNGDAFDENNGGAIGAEDRLLALGTVFLKGAKQDNDGLDNAFGIGLNESPYGTGFGNGVVDDEYFGMSYSSPYIRWGACLINNDSNLYYFIQNKLCQNYYTYGYRYVFPDTFDTYLYGSGGVAYPSQYLNEPSLGNLPGDRAGYATTGPFTIMPDSSYEVDIAYVTARSYQTLNDNIAPVMKLKTFIDSITGYYKNNNLPCGGNFTSVEKKKTDAFKYKCFPIPATDYVFVQVDKKLNQTVTLELMDINGKILQSVNSNNAQNILQLNQLSSGIYFLKIKVKDQVRFEKIIKN